jgi:hypothetical protein
VDDVRLVGPSSEPWPMRVGVVPPLAGCFQLRRSVLSAAEREASARVRVLAGLGGVGRHRSLLTMSSMSGRDMRWTCWCG